MGAPLTLDQVDPNVRAMAERDAQLLGIGFIVYGRYVSPDDVFVLSAGTTDNPIDHMRREKAEVKELLAKVEAIERPYLDKTLSNTLSVLRAAYEALGSNNGFVRSQARYAIGCFLHIIAGS